MQKMRVRCYLCASAKCVHPGPSYLCIITGETRVVGEGAEDLICINTDRIGVVEHDVPRREIHPWDVIIVSGSIGDHGIAVMAVRNKFSSMCGLVSD